MTIETITGQKIAYKRNIGPYGPNNAALMESMKEWAKEKGLLGRCSIYGIAYDEPDTPPEECRYDVAVTIENEDVLDDSVIPGQIPDGKYAVFTVKHTTYGIELFWKTVFTQLENNALVFDGVRPIMERYRMELISIGECEFCVPVL